VKFLIDNQLPVSLAESLRLRGFDCQHVLEAGLGNATGSDICRHAERQDRIVISKDEDFVYLAKRRHTEVRVIWVRLGNCRTPLLVAAFERSWPGIESWLQFGDRIIEMR
jgi:predicted nuclease of predicted toxin-antitoxin system